MNSNLSPGVTKSEPIYATRSAGQGSSQDPVCHMQVLPGSPHVWEYGGTTYHFCTERCMGKFRRWPQRFLHGRPR
jgi:Cu+-exporting ATPase